MNIFGVVVVGWGMGMCETAVSGKPRHVDITSQYPSQGIQAWLVDLDKV